jgi:hypothetical protein
VACGLTTHQAKAEAKPLIWRGDVGKGRSKRAFLRLAWRAILAWLGGPGCVDGARSPSAIWRVAQEAGGGKNSRRRPALLPAPRIILALFSGLFCGLEIRFFL